MRGQEWQRGDAVRVQVDTDEGCIDGWFLVTEVDPQFDPEGYRILGARTLSLIADPTNAGPTQSSEP